MFQGAKQFGAIAALAVASAASAPAAQAADSQQRYAIKGFGQMPCSRYSEAREKREPMYLIMGGWVEGYLTALNQASEDTYDLTSFETTDLLAGLIDRHCRRNPEHRFADVVRAMAVRLEEFRIKEYTELLSFEINGERQSLYRETVERIQARLVELGHLESAGENGYDEATIAAMRAFQTDVGIEPTGAPDQLTLMRMFRTREPAAQ